ncbi:lysozyme-like domain-containing protein [Chytriomyces sp. MP71]|nr:lysozyme-like domain-containing protein [Chytriomyces sp. MP71]
MRFVRRFVDVSATSYLQKVPSDHDQPMSTMTPLSTILILGLSLVTALPQIVPLRSGTSGSTCKTFGEWGCDHQLQLVQCSYVTESQMQWVFAGGPCSLLDASFTASESTSDDSRTATMQATVSVQLPIPASQSGLTQAITVLTGTLSMPAPQSDNDTATTSSKYVKTRFKSSMNSATSTSSSQSDMVTISTTTTSTLRSSTITSASTAYITSATYPTSSGVASLIDQPTFDAALAACGIQQSDMYASITKGFTVPLQGGLKEIALLLGNIAHESFGFKATEEFACVGVTSPTYKCPYGLYHGRGYIQLSWDYNYRSAATALDRPDILTNPTIVMTDLATNWATVQWFWTTSVQPALKSSGYTLAASVRAINGALECGGNPIAAQRIKYIQCFEDQLTGTVDTQISC